LPSFYQKKIQIQLSTYKNMANTKELSVEDKLRAIYDLQLIDSRIDEIRNVRGELPLEVEDLEDEVAGLSTRSEKLKGELEVIEEQIKGKKIAIDEHKEVIKKYTKQQESVRNNREFNSLTKEVEFQELEIQLAEKQIKEMKASIEHKKEVISNLKEKLDAKSSHLKHKKSELDAIMAETQKEEIFLTEKSAEFASQIEERLLAAYNRIRSSVRNGLAVVSIERGASAGSFFTIPPQTQVEIASRKKIITDEHSGRILVDSALAEEEKEKMEQLFSKI
jgi:predicted  nucleic acid-binding Zn-ribbon protein